MENIKMSEVIKKVNSAMNNGEKNTGGGWSISSRVYSSLDDESNCIIDDNKTYHEVYLSTDSYSCDVDSFMDGFERGIKNSGGTVIHSIDKYGFDDSGYKVIDSYCDDTYADIDDENDEDYYESCESSMTIGVKIKWNSKVIQD